VNRSKRERCRWTYEYGQSLVEDAIGVGVINLELGVAASHGELR
jgi:hypothetical protein